MLNSQDMELWWGMSRAEYLTIPRSIIQNMSTEWQDKFAKLLHELDDSVDWRPSGENQYWVKLGYREFEHVEDFIDEEGIIIEVNDPLQEYRHGNSIADSLFQNTNCEK